MKKSIIIFLVATIVFLSSCDNTRKYSVEELENNQFNSLNLPVKEDINSKELSKVVDELAELDTKQLLEQLEVKGLELNKASYAFYYLGNNAVKENDFEKFYSYHKIAAEQYLNPLSMIKLAQMYQRGLPQLKNPIRPDLARSYEYLHQAMECITEITRNNRTHVLVKNTKDIDMKMLEDLDKAAKAGAFKKREIREKLKSELPELLGHLKDMYKIKESK